LTPAELVHALRVRGVTLEPRGDKLRVRPVSLLTSEELDRLRAIKPAVLALLAPVLPRSAYAPPWPDTVLGLGARRVGYFAPCKGCGRGSWVRYGPAVLCLMCSTAMAHGTR
jgi:hypothetical protein